MVSKRQGSMVLLLFSLFLLSHFSSAKKLGIVTYWGMNVREGELDEACSTGNYDIINIGFLNTFGNGQTPDINLSGHCSESWGVPCTKYASQIAYCQSKGVKILLSLGGDSRTYSLSSAQDAKHVADYLWTNFLGGQNNTNSEGLLGNVVLDGIDLSIKNGGTCYYDMLARELDSYRKIRDFYLSAAPQCAIPDPYLESAIQTGLVDHVWVQFYNNPKCQYSPWDTRNILHSWNQWSSELPSSKLYLGLPASPAATAGRAGGYIPVDEFTHKILPHIKDTENYGGVMLWNRYYDLKSGYSDKIITGTSLPAFNNVATI